MGEYKFSRKELTTQEEVSGMIAKSRFEEGKFLIAFLYLFGCRVSEAISLKKEDVWKEPDRLVARIPIKKRRQHGPYGEPSHILEVSDSSSFAQVVWNWREKVSDGCRLFSKNRVSAWRRIKEASDQASPHIFRHDRLSKLAIIGASPYQLQLWAGWGDTRPIKNYVHLMRQDIHEISGKVE